MELRRLIERSRVGWEAPKRCPKPNLKQSVRGVFRLFFYGVREMDCSILKVSARIRRPFCPTHELRLAGDAGET